MEWFYWCNENVAVGLSLLINVTLIHFITIEQANALKSYRKMLLFNCIVDMFLAIATILLRPVSF